MNTYVITRYYGPTMHKGGRIRVTMPDGKWRVIAYDYAARCAHESAVRSVFGNGAYIERDFIPGNGEGYGFTVTLPDSV